MALNRQLMSNPTAGAASHLAALARAQDAVRSPRFRVLTLEIAVWLESGYWMTPQDDLVRDQGDVAIETSAAE